MLSGLATLADLTPEGLEALVRELGLPALEGRLRVEPRAVNHIAGVGCRLDLPHEHAHRNLAEISKIIADSGMPPQARELAAKAFALLAEAEGAVHNKPAREVTFHEVGALDSILDICLVCRLFVELAPERFVCGPLPLADGTASCAHGLIPTPAPAVLRLLKDVPVRSFAGQGETITPTAACLLKALGADFGGWPAMTLRKSVISYGSKIFENAPNGALWALGST